MLGRSLQLQCGGVGRKGALEVVERMDPVSITEGKMQSMDFFEYRDRFGGDWDGK